MQFMPRRPGISVLSLVIGFAAAACGGADGPAITAPPVTTAAQLVSTVESGPGGEYGCRGDGVREYAQPSWDSPTPLTFEEALTAPALDPGRLAYIFDAGDDAGPLNPTPAELDLAEAYWELERVAESMWEMADEAADREFVGTWIDDGVLMLSTTGDPVAVEAAMAEFTVPFEVVQVDFRAGQLNRWARAITDRVAVNEPLLVNIDMVRNVIAVQVSPEASLDLSGVACAAVELVFDQ